MLLTMITRSRDIWGVLFIQKSIPVNKRWEPSPPRILKSNDTTFTLALPPLFQHKVTYA